MNIVESVLTLLTNHRVIGMQQATPDRTHLFVAKQTPTWMVVPTSTVSPQESILHIVQSRDTTLNKALLKALGPEIYGQLLVLVLTELT